MFSCDIKVLNKGSLRGKTFSVFFCTKQSKGAEKGKALRYPGPDDSHLSPCHNTGAEVVEVHCLYRLPGTWTIRMVCKNRIQIRAIWRFKTTCGCCVSTNLRKKVLCIKDQLSFILFHQFPSQIHLSLPVLYSFMSWPTSSGGCWHLFAWGILYWHWTIGWALSLWPLESWRPSPEACQLCGVDQHSVQTFSYLFWSPPHLPLEMTQIFCIGLAKPVPPYKNNCEIPVLFLILCRRSIRYVMVMPHYQI